MKALFDLSFVFFKIGLWTIGGGYAMVPLMQKELVEKRRWLTETEFLDFFTIAQSTVGIIALNTAILTAYKLKGIPGAIAAVLGFITPSLVIISLIAAFLGRFRESPYMDRAFSGIAAAVTALLLNTVIKVGRNTIKTLPGFLIAAAALAGLRLFKVSPALIILGCLVLGLGLAFLNRRRDRGPRDTGEKGPEALP
ncbi:MAG: chromate transporter [Spirochaetales bacterium]|jgi:chromate transporter|nr:chromate transporter [Spirochaetales bacterium]